MAVHLRIAGFFALCMLPAPLVPGFLWAETVDPLQTDRVARSAITRMKDFEGRALVASVLSLRDLKGCLLARIYRLEPRGFLIIGGDTGLPPVMAFSLRSDLPEDGPQLREYLRFLRTDLSFRLKSIPRLPAEILQARRREWTDLSVAKPLGRRVRAFLRWPAAGTTPTEGWLESNWHQNAPYNDDCPMDSVNSARSVAGCPAVAMAMIMNYHRTTNQTAFGDSDDYYHSYAGRNYWIDDDAKTLDFPSFIELSVALGDLEDAYLAEQTVDDVGAAALIFACGVAAHQVFTSTVSGTFGVNQAEQAYQKFSVDDAELIFDTDPNLYSRLIWNMKHALPAHLAVVNEDDTSGHNVVVDGYTENNYYHLNFGWGGSANGWYLLPDGIPYGLTVIEGLILDINPSGILFKDGFEAGTASYWTVVVG